MQGFVATSVNANGGDNFYISSKNLPSGIYLSKIICENGSSFQKHFPYYINTTSHFLNKKLSKAGY